MEVYVTGAWPVLAINPVGMLSIADQTIIPPMNRTPTTDIGSCVDFCRLDDYMASKTDLVDAVMEARLLGLLTSADSEERDVFTVEEV